MNFSAPEGKKTVYRVLGVLIFAGCAYFFWRSVSAAGGDFRDAVQQDAAFYGYMAAGAIVYGASLTLLAAAWTCFLPAVERAGRSVRLVQIYGVSSIAKYLPGGVFHFGGRQIAGAKLGVSHKALAGASLYEAGLSIALALVIAGLLFVGGFLFVFALLGVAALGTALVAGGAMKDRFAGAVMVALFMAAMAALAAIFALLLGLDAGPGVVGAAYLAAWVIGFVAPGLSAGVGVREAAFVFLAAETAPAGELAALALFMRLLTTLGDAVFFIFFAVTTGRATPASG